MTKQHIIIGTRGSKLALAQTHLIKDQLQKLLPQTLVEIQVITTTGDKNMDPVPLDTVGKGWFTKELDKALLEGSIDLAVHSLKDIPEVLPEGLVIAAIPQREDAREALISREAVLFEKLPSGAVIGTDSTRRKSQILHKRPDLVVKSLRGNVNTRLEKLKSGAYDAIFLAVAGLKRLGLTENITQYFDQKEFVSSPGQGALAIVAQKDNTLLLEIVKKLNDPYTIAAVDAERAFSKAVGGGCKMPVGAYAEVKDNKLIIWGLIGSLDGKHLEKDVEVGVIEEAVATGERLAAKMLKTCAPWYSNKPGYIVVTRPEEDEDFSKKLEAVGLHVFSYPTIEIKKNILSEEEKKYLVNVETYDWIILTSQHGVDYFLNELELLGVDKKNLIHKNFAAVGPKTAEALENKGLSVHFIPSTYTTAELGEQLQNVKGKKILLARSNIANPILTTELQKKGADVYNVAIYQTTFPTKENKEFITLLENKEVQFITFSSPSTIEGFLKNLDSETTQKVLQIPVFSIGPVTTQAAEKFGFTTIHTADPHTIEGLLSKIKEIVL